MYASHMNFDAFVVFMREFDYSIQNNFKGSFRLKLKGAGVWPFNASCRLTGLVCHI